MRIFPPYSSSMRMCVCVYLRILYFAWRLPFIRENIYLSFWCWFISLSIMISKTGTILLQMVQDFILLNGYVVFLGVDVPPFLYPFLFQWTSGLFLCPQYGRLCCCKCRTIFICLSTLHPLWLHWPTSHHQWSKVPFPSHPCQQLLLGFWM